MARIPAHMSMQKAICPRSCVRPVGEPVHDERPHYRHDVPERWVRFRALGGEEDADGQGPINGADRIAGRK
jgi:hypothetical protein